MVDGQRGHSMLYLFYTWDMFHHVSFHLYLILLSLIPNIATYRTGLRALNGNTNFLLNTKIVGSHALLQQGNPEYDLKRQELYDHYHPLEIDPAIPLDKKAKLMEEWYVTLHILIMELQPCINFVCCLIISSSY